MPKKKVTKQASSTEWGKNSSTPFSERKLGLSNAEAWTLFRLVEHHINFVSEASIMFPNTNFDEGVVHYLDNLGGIEKKILKYINRYNLYEE